MSETNQPGAVAEEVPPELRILQILGIGDQDAEQNASPDSDAGEEDQAEQAAAPDEGQREDAEDEGEPENPAIEPPTFWNKEAKEHWEAIPAETQAYIVERETQRDQATQRAQSESAEARRQTEQLAAQFAQDRAYLQQQLLPAIQMVTQSLQGDYSPQALADLSRTNPAEYVAKIGERDRLLSVHQTLQQEAAQTATIVTQGELNSFIAVVPEARDPAKGKEIMNAVVDAAGQFRISAQELSSLVSGPGGHRALLVFKALHDAQTELASLKSAKQVPVRKAVTPVVKPPVNAQRPRSGTDGREFSRADLMKVARSGDRQAQEEVLGRLFG